MQSHRPPIFKDLLAHNISQEKLNQFLKGLTTDSEDLLHPATENTEVNKPLYCMANLSNNELAFFDSALCFAVHIHDGEIISALTKIGVNPNFSTSTIDNTKPVSAEPMLLTPILPLTLALYYAQYERDTFAPIISLLLNIPGIDIYATTHTGFNLFLYSECNSQFILRLFELDSQVASFDCEEKKDMSHRLREEYLKIKPTFKDNNQQIRRFRHNTNMAVCNALSRAYPNSFTQKRIEDEINKAFPLTTSGQPLTSIVLSYLFKPKSDALQQMEKWNEENAPRRPRTMGGRT